MNSPPVHERIEQIKQAVPALRILSAGWEGGDTQATTDDGEPIELRFGKTGGMGVIIPQLPLAMKRFAKPRGLDWSFANVVPLFPDIVSGVTADNDVIRLDGLKERGIVVDTGIKWTFAYDEQDYPVRLWRATVKHPDGDFQMTKYLLEQDDLWGRDNLALLPKPDGGKPEPDLYEVPSSKDSFPANVYSSFVSSAYSMAQFQRIRYLVFARAVAALYYGTDDPSRSRLPSGTSLRPAADPRRGNDNGTDSTATTADAISPFHVLISHDFHAGLAVFYERETSPIVQLSVGHNLAYQGIDAFYSPNSREANVNYREKENWRLLKESYAELLGLDAKVMDDYLVAWAGEKYIGTPNWTQGVLRKNFYRTGLAMTTVSPGYADEQREGREDVLRAAGKAVSDQRYKRRACRERLKEYFDKETQQDDLFVPNQNLADLRKYKVVGILNGMFPSEGHLLRKRGLRSLLDDLGLSKEVGQLRKFCDNGKPPAGSGDDKSDEWAKYKRGFDEAAAALTRIKERSKKELFVRFPGYFQGKKIDREKPILFAWGRLVSQKGFHIIHEAVTSEKTRADFDRANIVVLGTAPEGDVEALEVEERLRRVDRDNLVFINHFDPAFRDMCLLAASGALLTPMFEPCGLTDIEAYWFGTPCVVHKTGGLVKGIQDPETYTQIRENFPEGEPVAESYEYYDNTDPVGEAVAFTHACGRLLAWDRQTRQRRQLKALTLMQFTYDIPANRYVDLVQFTWLNQVWRHLKDRRATTSKERLATEAADFICGTDNGFVAGNSVGCCRTFKELFTRTFAPPNGDDPSGEIGVDHLDDDIELDRALWQELRERHD